MADLHLSHIISLSLLIMQENGEKSSLYKFNCSCSRKLLVPKLYIFHDLLFFGVLLQKNGSKYSKDHIKKGLI
jgi:hypothetical protein